ncbi:PHD finger protein 3 [Auxenochlorella protothecoides]|uniref:PHD finger protein 3 n=1 Tax=Auxenochlorella protothecoides TaxID=3075 RepID=A0A087SBQ8_AUXPR|nr:PHD finger protein 3 [Auxenochlorella protothecoides]KFM23162.1 PHD finger protein 3 [Auxenochlorella protothecoides]
MYVYRLMKPSEIKSTLVSRTVYVLWPDEEQANATWYRARVDECKVASKKGDLYYEDTDELETGADLADLVYQGHIAFREPRPLHHDLGRDEVGLDAPYTGRALEERLGHLPVTAASASPESSISDAGARDNSAEDSDFEVEAARERQSGSKRRRASTGEEDSDGEQVGSPSASEDDDADGSGSDEVPLVARAAKMERRRASRGGARGNDGDDDDEDAAERAAQKLLRQAQGGASGTPRSKPQGPSDFYGSGTPRRHQADHLSDAGVRQGLEQALELAVGEAAVRGEQCPLTSGQVAAAVEAALFRLHGGTSREYKTRYRTLQFNLKDPANPDLRGEVMAGRLAPEKLVTLSATELANKELTEYRRRKEEEALKMAVLDAEAAARFSTAAALETRESQPRKEAQEAAVREARGGEAARAVGEAAETPDAGSSPPAEEPGAGDAAGDAVAGAASMDAGVLDHDRNPVPELEPGADGSVLVTLEGLAGAVSPALLLGDRDVEVRGRVTLARLEEFLLDLRHSRHRAVSAGVAGLAPGASPREAGLWADLLALDETTRAAEDEDEDEEGAESIPGGDPSTKPKLLPALTAFQSVSGPPAFLNPEGKGGGRGDGSWDVSKMAPKLKEEAAAAGPGVIKASAVQYRGGEGPTPVSAAAIALLGGGEKPDRGKPSKAMGVEEFLDKGAGGAVLPRKRQERKDREKDKRSKGQSSHAAWKSEAEMVLRQQYD